MGRKNRDMGYLKPFCYYCDKTFTNELTLHQHQKAKHFTCQRCQKKFSSCDSLKNHVESAHREQLNKIANALPDRCDVKNKIFGMQGVPKIEVEKRIRMGAEEYWTKALSLVYQRTKRELKTITKKISKEPIREEKKKLLNIKKERNEINQEEYTVNKSQPISFNLLNITKNK